MTTTYRPNPWCCGLEHDDNDPDTCPATRATCDCGTCATYHLWARDAKGRQMTKVAQIRAEVFEHLQTECEAPA